MSVGDLGDVAATLVWSPVAEGHVTAVAGLWRVLGLGDDFDSGADGDNVVKVDHVGIA